MNLIFFPLCVSTKEASFLSAPLISSENAAFMIEFVLFLHILQIQLYLKLEMDRTMVSHTNVDSFFSYYRFSRV